MTDETKKPLTPTSVVTTAALVVASAYQAVAFGEDMPTCVSVSSSWLALLAEEIEELAPGFLNECRWFLDRECDPTEQLTAGVYFVRSGDAIKIGMSKDVPGRLRALRTMSPLPLELLLVVPGGRDEEAALHEQWASVRLHGEWFQATPELLSYVTQGFIPVPQQVTQ